MKKKKIILIILLTILVAVLGLCFVDVYKRYNESQIVIDEEPIEEEPVEEVNQVWLDNYAINDDYIGELAFESGLITDSVVQAKKSVDSYTFYDQGGHVVKNKADCTGNDVYIWMNWKTGEWDFNDHGGSVFMDYRNNIDDQNLIIYGHHFSEAAGYDPKREKAFTPLEQLFEQENYEKNKYLTLTLEKEVRRYELVCVYNFNVDDNFHWDNLQYYRPNYNFDDFTGVVDEDYYANYIEGLEKVKLYDTGVKLTTDDKTITLQTCISGHQGQLFEICVFKQI